MQLSQFTTETLVLLNKKAFLNIAEFQARKTLLIDISFEFCHEKKFLLTFSERPPI
jgi:hypothetical protein